MIVKRCASSCFSIRVSGVGVQVSVFGNEGSIEHLYHGVTVLPIASILHHGQKIHEHEHEELYGSGRPGRLSEALSAAP